MRRRYIGKGVDDNTLLLLHFDDNLIDETGRNLGVQGNNITYSSDSKFGKSIKFPNNSNIIIPANDDLILSPGKDMTIDFWIKGRRSDDYVISLYGTQGSESSPRGVQFSISNNYLSFHNDYDSNGYWISANMPTNQWTHIALVYLNNVFYLYKNGSRISSFTRSLGGYKNRIIIGQARDSSHSLNGCIDEYRISNIARWTSNFQVPEIPY